MENNKQKAEWDKYWGKEKKRKVYDVIAKFYRDYIIKGTLNYFIKDNFKKDESVLHAGCGSGGVDTDIKNYIKITAFDISDNALKIYKEINGENSITVKGDILHTPFKDEEFDGIYNLGVMEHFEEKDVIHILKEFHRILKPGGRIVLLIPPEYGLSVMFFKVLKFIFRYFLFNKDIEFHPAEICRIKSKKHAIHLVESGGFTYKRFYFGIKDFFTYAIVIAEKK